MAGSRVYCALSRNVIVVVREFEDAPNVIAEASSRERLQEPEDSMSRDGLRESAHVSGGQIFHTHVVSSTGCETAPPEISSSMPNIARSRKMTLHSNNADLMNDHT